MSTNGKKLGDFLSRLSGDLGRIGQEVQQAVQQAGETPAGRKVREVIAEVRPQVKKAVEDLGPQVKRAVDEIRPEMKKVVDQIKPQVSRAWTDLFGREEPRRPPGAAGGSGAPPNVSPDAYAAPSPVAPAPTKTVGRKDGAKAKRKPASKGGRKKPLDKGH